MLLSVSATAIPERVTGDVVEPHIAQIPLGVPDMFRVTFSCRATAVEDNLALTPRGLGTLTRVYLRWHWILLQTLRQFRVKGTPGPKESILEKNAYTVK